MSEKDIKGINEYLFTILCFCIWKPLGFIVLIMFLLGGSNE